MANQAAQTAYGPTTIVAIEQFTPEEQRLLHDPLAYQILSFSLRVIVSLTRWPPARKWLFNFSEGQACGIWGGILCRKRYIDDKLKEALQAGGNTLVVLGAGLDTHAYRLEIDIPTFEVDLPENVTFKRNRLQQLFGRVPGHVHQVPLDFDQQDLASALTSQGYHREGKSFFIWEGVTQYLTEPGIRKTFKFLAQAAPKSQLVFTYVRKDFIEGKALDGLDKLYEQHCIKNQIWHFGFDSEQVENFLEEYGWKVLEQVSGQECSKRYLKPIGRTLPVMEIEKIVHAQKLGVS